MSSIFKTLYMITFLYVGRYPEVHYHRDLDRDLDLHVEYKINHE